MGVNVLFSHSIRAGTPYPSEAHEFTPGFQWDSYCSIFSFLCSLLYFIVCPFGFCFVLPIVLSDLLRFTASDYPFVILKHFPKGLQSKGVHIIAQFRPWPYFSCIHLTYRIAFNDSFKLTSNVKFDPHNTTLPK